MYSECLLQVGSGRHSLQLIRVRDTCSRRVRLHSCARTGQKPRQLCLFSPSLCSERCSTTSNTCSKPDPTSALLGRYSRKILSSTAPGLGLCSHLYLHGQQHATQRYVPHHHQNMGNACHGLMSSVAGRQQQQSGTAQQRDSLHTHS